MKFLSALLFSLFASGVQAFPSGAGGCPAGVSAVGGIHLAQPATKTGSLATAGYTVTVDGETLSPGATYTFRSGVKHVLKVSGNKPFRGFLFRIGGSGTSALEISKTFFAAQISSLCVAAGSSGVTHLESSARTEAEAIIAIESADSALTLDVTVVIANYEALSEHYYSGYKLVASASAPTPPTPSPNSGPIFPIDRKVCGTTGAIIIAGSTTVLPIANLWAKGYTRSCGNVVTVTGGGTSVGARRVCGDSSKGETQVDIGNMSRDWKSSEAKVASDTFTYRCVVGDTALDVIQVAVAMDGLTIVTSTSATGGAACIEKLGGLTTDQLRWIFSSHTAAKLTASGWKSSSLPNSDGNDSTHLWSELNANCVKEEILIGGEGDQSETTATFIELILTDTANKETFRTPYVNNADPDVIANTFVKGCSTCIAYFGYSYYLANILLFQPAPIKNKAGDFIAPTAESVGSGLYNPLSRFIYMNVNKARRPKLEGFFKYGFSDAGDADVTATGYVVLPAATQTEMLARSKKNYFGWSVCFTGESQVHVQNQGPTMMWDLVIGDMVKVANNKYEPVYSFGHKEAGLESDFISIATKGSRNALELSADHMVVVEGGRNVPASLVAVGDMLVTASGELAAVKSIRTVTRTGAFAPFTRSGSIVVNDLVVSNYVAFNGSEYLKIDGVETPFTFQWLAHIFNSVHRVAYMMGFKGETYTEVGVSHWVDAGHRAAGWLLEQNSLVMFIILLASIAFFGTVSIIEAAILSPVTTSALVAGALLARPFASVKATAKKA